MKQYTHVRFNSWKRMNWEVAKEIMLFCILGCRNLKDAMQKILCPWAQIHTESSMGRWASQNSKPSKVTYLLRGIFTSTYEISLIHNLKMVYHKNQAIFFCWSNRRHNAYSCGEEGNHLHTSSILLFCQNPPLKFISWSV